MKRAGQFAEAVRRRLGDGLKGIVIAIGEPRHPGNHSITGLGPSRPTAYDRAMNAQPIVLVPGFWLGAWAWDEVVGALRAEGHDVTALTLPGLESADTDRSSITLADHVDAICEAMTAVGRPVVLAVHSGAASPGYAVTDRMPEQIAAMIYVDSGPATGALDPDLDAVEVPLPSADELPTEETSTGSPMSSSRPSGGGPCLNLAAHCARPSS